MIGLGISVVAGFLSLFSDFEIRPRTGEYFQSTRVPYAESYGMRFYDLGYVCEKEPFRKLSRFFARSADQCRRKT